MKKIEVNHEPDFVSGLIIALLLLWIVPTAISLFLLSYTLLTLSVALFIAVIIWVFLIANKKTIVEYDDNKIQWKWQWLTYTVNFNDMESVHYTITSERTRYGGYIRRLEIVFKVNNEELRLNDKLKTEDIENSINGTPEDIHLMQLYKFIENIYPEKCSGFTKTDDIF